MEPPPTNVRRHFLTWERPLLPQAVEWFANGWAETEALDLSAMVVIVPTRQSGRRLREALAVHASAREQAVFPPRIILPESLVSGTSAAKGVANRVETVLAWVEVLRSTALDEYRSLLPVDPPEQDFAWALRLAEDFVRVQQSLGEAGLRVTDVPAKVGSDFPEFARWEQFASLEQIFLRTLGGWQLRDMQAERFRFAQSPQLDPGIERIVLLGTPDPVPLARAALARLGQSLPLDILVFAPAAEESLFDEWGQPVPDVWAKRPIAVDDFYRTVHVCADPAAQAHEIVALTSKYEQPETVVGIGIADREATGLMASRLQDAGLAPFDPDGQPRVRDEFYQLLSCLAALSRNDAFASVEALARCPAMLDYFKRTGGGTFSAAVFLSSLDRLHKQHLPATLGDARRHAPHNAELAAIAELRATLTQGTFPENVTAALAGLFGSRKFDLSTTVDAELSESIQVWMQTLHEIGAAAQRIKVTNQELWELALKLFSGEFRYDEKPPKALELQGWLELLFDDAPHLLVAGLNDGRVPEAIVGDPFLPEALRERLGLKTNSMRFARDAYILRAIAACRQIADSEVGPGQMTESPRSNPRRLDLWLGKTSAAGDPLRPSRLLLRCSDNELPERIGFLFRDVVADTTAPAWRRAWRLTPRRVTVPEKMAVTALRAWLDCPFRFYLGRVLKMEPVDPVKAELDATDFGTLCHAALEAMGADATMRDCTDARKLRNFLLDTLDSEAHRRFRRELALPLLVQLESARQRLSRAAEIQAETRADGWVIIGVEQPFEFVIEGLVVRGKIDRIERHDQLGYLRVLDYKTSDRPVEPWQAHLRPFRPDEHIREFSRVMVDDKEMVWTDLQLPLYRRAIADRRIELAIEPAGQFPVIQCAYFNLPKAASATGIKEWNGFTRELEVSAWQCASGVARAIRAGEFWPPNEKIRPENDPFAPLFHHTVADSVVWNDAAIGQTRPGVPAFEPGDSQEKLVP